MDILIVAATSAEIAPLTAQMRSASRHRIDVLTTGIGMVATAARTARALARQPYALALNLGLCGSFDAGLVPGTVVHVVRDQIAELGAEDDEAFLTMADVGLDAEAVFVNHAPPDSAALRRLPVVEAITVNTVHGRDRSIAAVVERLRPQVESMEGAAFMSACLDATIPHAQVRAISNVVERRNRSAWRLPEAIDSLTRVALRILDDL